MGSDERPDAAEGQALPDDLTCGGCGGPLDDPPPTCPRCQPAVAPDDLERARLRRRVDELERALAEEEAAATRAGELMEEAERGQVRAEAERDAATARAEALRGALAEALESLTRADMFPEMRTALRRALAAAKVPA